MKKMNNVGWYAREATSTITARKRQYDNRDRENAHKEKVDLLAFAGQHGNNDNNHETF